MMILERLKFATAWVACAGMLTPAATLGAPPANQTAHQGVRDVSLAAGGTLYGQLVDQQGRARPGQTVSLSRDRVETARVVTDAEGRFVFQGLVGGVYELTTSQSHGVYRMWAERTAPPRAVQAVLLVDRANLVVRGQYPAEAIPGPAPPANGYVESPGYVDGSYAPPGVPPCGPECGPPCAAPCGPCGGCFGFLTSPWVIGGVIAAAIAIPLAVANNDDDENGS
jgi:hypothetical protein